MLRLISILSVLSKILEEILEKQINTHIEKFNILSSKQSGFCKGYLCSSAFLDDT